MTSDYNLAWLNAYNAPHWMNIYASLGLSPSLGSSSGNFRDGTSNTFEIYGTSWERDMLKAWSLLRDQQLSAGLLSANQITINGLSDPAYRAMNSSNTYPHPLHITGGHSIGMSIDLGLNEFINWDNQNNILPGQNPSISAQLPSGTPGWSVANAVAWSDLLPDDLMPNGKALNAQQALRNFLALVRCYVTIR